MDGSGEDTGVEVAALWDAVASRLQDRIARTDFMSWFYRVEPRSFEGGELVVAFANEFAARWVRDRFFDVMEATLREVAGEHARLTIVSRETVEAEAAHVAPPAPDREAVQRPDAESMSETELRAAIGSHVARLVPGGDVSRSASEGADEAGRVPDQPLQPRYRFDTFVISHANRVAHAAALNVAESPGQSYNPLFIHGGTGVGKTHLLHAIGHYARETRPGISVAYTTTEQFVTQFIRAIRHQHKGRREVFKRYFRSIDVLLLDDVQFLSGKGASTQDELFFTFNALHESGKQVVLTSDCAPADIPQLEEKLRSRFSWGLITDMGPPDHAARVAILRKRAALDRIVLDQSVLDEIAERAATNVRELEGVLTRIVGLGSLTGRPIDVNLCREVLDRWASVGGNGELTIDRIQRVVCDHFDVSQEDLVGARRSNDIARPRQIAMYLSRVLLGAPSTQIGQRFGGRDHSTVLHAERRIDSLIREDSAVSDLVERLSTALRHGTPGSVRELR